VSWEETEERPKSEEAEEKEHETCQSRELVSGLTTVRSYFIPVSTLEKANATNVVATISRGLPSPISWAMRVAII